MSDTNYAFLLLILVVSLLGLGEKSRAGLYFLLATLPMLALALIIDNTAFYVIAVSIVIFIAYRAIQNRSNP